MSLFSAGAAPLFLLPVFRKGGHFKLITQWQKDCFVTIPLHSSAPILKTTNAEDLMRSHTLCSLSLPSFFSIKASC